MKDLDPLDGRRDSGWVRGLRMGWAEAQILPGGLEPGRAGFKSVSGELGLVWLLEMRWVVVTTGVH